MVEQPLNMSTCRHFIHRKMVQCAIIDKGDAVTHSECHVKFMGGEQHAFIFLTYKSLQECHKFVTVGDVKK